MPAPMIRTSQFDVNDENGTGKDGNACESNGFIEVVDMDVEDDDDGIGDDVCCCS